MDEDPSAAPPISGVAEIVLSVRDLPRMRDFYVEFPAMQARALFFEDPEHNQLELIWHHAG